MMKPLYNLGAKIRQAREAAGMSQADLAKKLHYKSASTVARIEAGINDLTQSKIVSFASALGVPVGFLLGDNTTAAHNTRTASILRELKSRIDAAFDDALAALEAEGSVVTPEERRIYERVRRLDALRVKKESTKSDAG